ncbi:MAG: hypothetical protein GW876_12210, partial [Bacteroidetes bacterium]|nr:hypothetical protein [Bacteroidota bacterium]
MRTSIIVFSILILFSAKNIFAQNNSLTVKINKISNDFYSVNEQDKHLVSFEIIGIKSNKQAENLLKSVRGYRGVENFNLSQISETNNWQATAVFYKYAKEDYFKYFFKFMKVNELIIDSNKVL